MKYIVNMIDQRGKSKIKIVDAFDVKEAELKAKNRYPSYEIGRISKQDFELEYYAKMKQRKS